MQTIQAGTSVAGRPITYHLFGPDMAAEASQPWNTLFFGVIHGDEQIAGALLECLLRELELTAEKTRLFGQGAVAVMPVLNPDGLANGTRVNENGVDLNRNCPTKNWVEENKGEPYYSGPGPASEPETRLIIDLIEKYQPRKIVAVHSPYKVINYDGPAQELAEAMAAQCGYPAVADIGYATPGSMGTYFGVERNIPIITLELPEDEPLNEVWAATRPALLEAINFT